MKQGTQLHPKFKTLAKALKLRQFETVGVLETLWMMACQFAGEDGDLSRFTHQEIADWIDWPGDSDCLIRALIECRWLDFVDGTLRVHDWLDHCPHYLKDRFRKQKSHKSTGKALASSKSFQEIPGGSGRTPGSSDPSLVQSSLVQSSLVSKGTGKRFTPPTIEQVREYVLQLKLPVDAQRFVDFYTTKDWMVGKNKMKDWRAAARNWGRSEQPKPQTATRKEIDFVN